MIKNKKSILITGCSSGIGLDAALTLDKIGWTVFATCKNQKDCRILRSKGLVSFPLDLSDSKSITRAVNKVYEKCDGKLDALLNNGAFAIPGAMEDLPRDALREIFEVNLFGQLELIRKCLPLMRANRGGKILNCSSVLGFTALPFRGAYVGTKFALEGITDSMRRENIEDNIKFVLIEPGPINTKIRQNSQKHYEKWVNKAQSIYENVYTNVLEKRLYGNDYDFFELKSSAVTAKIIKALNSKKPKARYYVTTPTLFADFISRFFPTKMQDIIFRYRLPKSLSN